MPYIDLFGNLVAADVFMSGLPVAAVLTVIYVRYESRQESKGETVGTMANVCFLAATIIIASIIGVFLGCNGEWPPEPEDWLAGQYGVNELVISEDAGTGSILCPGEHAAVWTEEDGTTVVGHALVTSDDRFYLYSSDDVLVEPVETE